MIIKNNKFDEHVMWSNVNSMFTFILTFNITTTLTAHKSVFQQDNSSNHNNNKGLHT